MSDSESGLLGGVDFAVGPDVEISVARSHGLVLIELKDPAGGAPLTLDPVLASMTLEIFAKALENKRLGRGFNLAVLGWSVVLLLAQSGQGGAAISMRAVELNQPLPVTEAQRMLRDFVVRTAKGRSVDPFIIGRALSACIVHLGTSASDLRDVLEPLRRSPEVTGILAPA